jgi:hypothetical protein
LCGRQRKQQVLDGGVLVLHGLREPFSISDDLTERLPRTRLGASNGGEALEFCTCHFLNAARVNSGALQST